MNTSGRAAGTINVSELLENSRIGPLQVRVFALTMASLIMDGFDVQAMSYVAPAVVADWGIGGSASCAREARGRAAGGSSGTPGAGSRSTRTAATAWACGSTGDGRARITRTPTPPTTHWR